MSAFVIIVCYFVIGAGAAVAVVVQGKRFAGLRGPAAGAVVLVLWPFVLPALGGEPVRVLGSTPRQRRIEALAASFGGAARSAGVDLGTAQAIERFVLRLRSGDQRVVELDRALRDAPGSARDKLSQLRAHADHEVEQGCALLEEVVAQLTVLRFTEARTSAGREREGVEALLAQIEALAELSAG